MSPAFLFCNALGLVGWLSTYMRCLFWGRTVARHRGVASGEIPRHRIFNPIGLPSVSRVTARVPHPNRENPSSFHAGGLAGTVGRFDADLQRLAQQAFDEESSLLLLGAGCLFERYMANMLRRHWSMR